MKFLYLLLLLPQLLNAQVPAAPVRIQKKDFKPGKVHFHIVFQSDSGYAPVKAHVYLQDYFAGWSVYYKNVSVIDTVLSDTVSLSLNAWAPGYALYNEFLGYSMYDSVNNWSDTIGLPARDRGAGSAYFSFLQPAGGNVPCVRFIADYLETKPGKASLSCYYDAYAELDKKEELKGASAFALTMKNELAAQGLGSKTVSVKAKRRHPLRTCGFGRQAYSDTELKLRWAAAELLVTY